MLQECGQKINIVIKFDIKDDVLIERIEGRRVHPASGRSYHVKFNPPKIEGKDDVSGEDLIQRPDDNADALKSRLENYHKQTSPIAAYYEQKGVILNINADQAFEFVEAEINKGFENIQPGV